MGSKHINMTDSSLPDRISDLPSSIIDCMLDRLPIRDAVATSLLSKEWRHKWRTLGNLVFDKGFVDHVISRRTRGEPATMKYEYSSIIGKILLLHLGPIRKFVLHSPNFGNSLKLEDILRSWILFISQNGVKELTIDYQYKFRLPSYVFCCNELQHLKIDVSALDFHPPQDFRGFCNLISLDLSGLPDGVEISKFIPKCPMLERLSVHILRCTCSAHRLVIDAPRLRFLYAHFEFSASIRLKDVHNVTAFSLCLSKHDLAQVPFHQLIDMIFFMPKVESVYLCHLHKITVVPQDAPKSLPTTLHNHKSLTLLEIDISLHQCIYFILCLLKSSPNLQYLNLGIHPPATNEVEAALHLLQMQTREPQIMNSLSTVKIKGICGSKVEIMFIKLILSCSSVLKTMYLTGARNLKNEAEFTLVSSLLEYPRISCQAHVIYSKHPGDSSIFDF